MVVFMRHGTAAHNLFSGVTKGDLLAATVGVVVPAAVAAPFIGKAIVATTAAKGAASVSAKVAAGAGKGAASATSNPAPTTKLSGLGKYGARRIAMKKALASLQTTPTPEDTATELVGGGTPSKILNITVEKALKNSKLLPSQMRVNGPIHSQVKKFIEYIEHAQNLDKSNLDITYCCSDLIRTQQTLCTFRCFYELHVKPPLLTDQEHTKMLEDLLYPLNHNHNPSVGQSIPQEDMEELKKSKKQYESSKLYLMAWADCMDTSLQPSYLNEKGLFDKGFYQEMDKITFFQGKKRELVKETIKMIKENDLTSQLEGKTKEKNKLLKTLGIEESDLDVILDVISDNFRGNFFSSNETLKKKDFNFALKLLREIVVLTKATASMLVKEGDSQTDEIRKKQGEIRFKSLELQRAQRATKYELISIRESILKLNTEIKTLDYLLSTKYVFRDTEFKGLIGGLINDKERR